MQKEEQIKILELLLQHVDNGTNVDAGGIRKNPVSAYTCADIAEKEWQSFFRTHPQIVGMTGDLPDEDVFFTRDDFGLPLLAVRDGTGKFRAFINVCRHRGAILEKGGRGKKHRFTCPFHAWTYDIQGNLIAVPKNEHFGIKDQSCFNLIEIPAVERHGFLFVHPQSDGVIDVDALFSGLAPEFESWGFGDLIFSGEDSYETPMNWKLAMDTFGETYHFSALHQNSLLGSLYGNVQTYDVYGRNHRMVLCRRGIQALRDRPNREWDITEGGLPVYYLFPNVQVNVLKEGIILVRIYPVAGAPNRSVSRVSFYFNADTLHSNLEFVERQRQEFKAVVCDEDYVAAASSQISAEAKVQETIVFGRNEPALHHFHNTYREALGMAPLPLDEG